MIEELITSLTARSVRGAREAGLVREIAGIQGRHRRNQEAWAPHLQHTKECISAHLWQADPKEPILVLGAGLLLDVPLDALNAHPAGALLVDAVETNGAKRLLKRYENIAFEQADATGFIEPFWLGAADETIAPPKVAPLPLVNHGMAISLNILSQLPLAFAQSPPNGDTEEKLTLAVHMAHIRALMAMDCPVLLITDYERHETSNGKTDVIKTVERQLIPGDPLEEWEWHIAPMGEVTRGLDIYLKVGAWMLNF